jgi:hypothetical protein
LVLDTVYWRIIPFLWQFSQFVSFLFCQSLKWFLKK